MSEIRQAIRREHRNLAEESRYKEHAAPESIAAYLSDAVAALDELQQHIRWLSALQGQRAAEKHYGLWPRKEASDAD